MSLGGHSTAGPGRRASRQLQWPFVGIVVLLVVLILLTPNLFTATGGGLGTRAQLVVDRSSNGGPTSYYVDSLGTSTRYQSVAVGLASLPSWPYKGTPAGISGWNWTNGTETLVLFVRDGANPVAVNVTVMYADPSGFTEVYVGLYAFHFNATTQSLDAMALLSGATIPPATTPLADLPIFLLLSLRTSTGTP